VSYIKKIILSRPVVKWLVEEYIAESSPMISKYVKRMAEVTGLPEEVVRRSAPVRNLIKRIVGNCGSCGDT